jgi:hypothetical protein
MTIAQYSKEVFFRDLMLPTGFTAEVLLHQLVTQHGYGTEAHLLGDALWEPLNHTSHYVLGNRTGLDLTSIATAVDKFRLTLVHILRRLPNPSHPDGKTFRVFRPEQIREMLKNVTEALNTAIGYGELSRDKWLALHTSEVVPFLMRNAPGKWRTFARNLVDKEAVEGLFHQPHIKASVNAVGCRAGTELARSLWVDCFSNLTEPTADNLETVVVPTPSGAIPPGVNVEILPTRFFKVSTLFDPRRHLPADPMGEEASTLPQPLAEAAAPKNIEFECSYETLSATITKVVNALLDWERELPELVTKVQGFYDTRTQEALMARLKSSFSEAEIAVLKKQMLVGEPVA